ncbi:hypothetical protein EMCRGX_G026859 [Ephydatia muelleri]
MDHEILRGQIVAKLKKYEAYIGGARATYTENINIADNELPDYIMVMLANKKSVHQINNDLQLFLGENTDPFTDWLQQFLEAEKHTQQQGIAPEPTPIRTTPTPIRTTPTGAKRPRVDDSVSEVQRNEDRVVPNGKEEPEPVPSKVSRVKVDMEENRRSSQKRVLVEAKSDGGRGRDLRELLAERRGPRRPSGSAVDEEEEEGERANVSSVVKLVERPRGATGTTRLLERAIKGISVTGGRGKSKHLTPLVDNTGGLKTTVEKGTRAEVKGRTESDEPEQVEEIFVDEFRAEQQIENEVQSPQMVPSAVKGSEVRSMATEVKQIAAAKQTSNISNVSPPADLRELLNRSKEAGKDTRFVVTMTGLKDKQPEPLIVKGEGSAATMEEEIKDEASKGGSLERCRFWPNCKNGDTCPYLHPSVACRVFPNCKYGNKCHYVHPVCKFDSRCSRPDCPYLHTAPRKMLLQPPKPPAVAPLFRPSTFKPSHYSFGGAPWQRRQKFPTKSDLTWTPSKEHISERQFAVSEEQSTQLSI